MHGLAGFFRFWIWFSFRQMRAHFWRTIAVLVGIGLGAAVFTSVRLAVDASLDSFTRSVDALSGKSDWTVLCPGGRVPESLIPQLIKHPAVQALSPLSTTYVQPDHEAAQPILLIGLDPILDRSVRTWQPESSDLAQASSHPKSAIHNGNSKQLDPPGPPHNAGESSSSPSTGEVSWGCCASLVSTLPQPLPSREGSFLVQSREGSFLVQSREGSFLVPDSPTLGLTQNLSHPQSDIRHPTSDIPTHPQSDIPTHPTSEIRHPKSQTSMWLELISEPFTLIAGEKVYDMLHLQTGESLTLNHPHGSGTFRVLGKLAARGLALAGGGEIALIDIATFQEFTGTHGYADRIDLILKPTAARDAPDQIRNSLPPGVTLEQPSDLKESGKSMVHSYQLNLSVLSFVSLFVGMFLVYSLISLHATSRRHELAILRSLGASSRLVFLLFLSEGAFFGCVGWLIAIPLGSFMVKYLLGHVSATISHLFVRVQVDRLLLDPWEILLSFSTTFLVSLLAAWRPAYEAMQVAPREVLQTRDLSPRHANRLRNLALWGLVLIGLVWPLSRLPGTSGVPLAGYAATFLLFSGFSLISPWFLQIIGRILPPLLRRTAGEPAYLGSRYVRDAGTRIAVSVGALITAMALFVALVIMIHSFRKTVELWVTQSISGDLYLRPKLAADNEYRDVLPSEVVSILKNLTAPVDLIPYRRIYLRYGRVPYQFEVLSFESFMRHAQFLFVEGDPQQILPQLKDGKGVLVSEVFANATGVGTGKRFQAGIGQAHLDLPVLGVIRDFRTQGGVVYHSMSHFQDLSGDTNWSGVRFNLIDRREIREDAADLLRSQVFLALGRFQYGVEVTLGRDLRHAILKIFDETFAITTVLLLIALAVATLGITSTLTVLVLDRSRQFHTILACGGTRGQVRLMILWEAIIMVFTGEWLGLACGFALSYLLVFVINRQSFGWTFIYAVDWMSLSLASPLILATALLAAIPSSQIVFGTSPAMVLREQ